ncbi:MAG: response regulator [Candidatus Zixiibacteriota bacterium]
MVINKAKIVLVADDSDQMKMLIEALESGKHSVITIKSLDFAVEFVKKNEINILIIDIGHVDGNAGAMIQAIRDAKPEISIILITGQPPAEIASSITVDGIVSKPFRISHIEELIRKSIKKHPVEADTTNSILVVDDDDIFRTLLIRSLKIANYNALGASDGKMAMDILKQQKVSFVIADVNMPYLDGVSLLKHIKTDWPHIPVILITGYYSAGESPTSEETVPDGFLMKPFKINNIIELLDSISRRSDD